MTSEFSLKTAPAVEPVSLAEAKAHCRISHNTEDQLLANLIATARAWVEQYTGRSLYTQTWQLSLPGFASRLWLPRAVPLTSITFVKYYDADNVLQTLATSVYTAPAFSEPAVIQLVEGQSWPSVAIRTDAVQVEYVTGTSTIEAIPRPLLHAILLLVGHWYENREPAITGHTSNPIEFAVEALCGPYRVFHRDPEC
jgi:uncharacterized phiE125 gp8 family phage protein